MVVELDDEPDGVRQAEVARALRQPGGCRLVRVLRRATPIGAARGEASQPPPHESDRQSLRRRQVESVGIPLRQHEGAGPEVSEVVSGGGHGRAEPAADVGGAVPHGRLDRPRGGREPSFAQLRVGPIPFLAQPQAFPRHPRAVLEQVRRQVAGEVRRPVRWRPVLPDHRPRAPAVPKPSAEAAGGHPVQNSSPPLRGRDASPSAITPGAPPRRTPRRSDRRGTAGSTRRPRTRPPPKPRRAAASEGRSGSSRSE